jgi:hypothetical protein
MIAAHLIARDQLVHGRDIGKAPPARSRGHGQSAELTALDEFVRRGDPPLAQLGDGRKRGPLSTSVALAYMAQLRGELPVVWTNHHYLLRYATEATPRLL